MRYSLFFNSSDGGPIPPASPLGSLQPDLYQRRDGPVFLSARRYIMKTLLVKLHRCKVDFKFLSLCHSIILKDTFRIAIFS